MTAMKLGMMLRFRNALERYDVLFVIYTSTAAFMAYLCAYAFRKPFTAGSYENIVGWDYDIDFKVALVIAQVFEIGRAHV